MLPFNQMVAPAKPYLEWMYQDTCTIIEHQKVKNEDGSTTFKDVVVLEDEKCRLSYKTDLIAGNTESASPLKEDIELFISPDIEIKPGSKLMITHLGVTTEFKRSGEPARYNTHQEIHLELFKGWT